MKTWGRHGRWNLETAKEKFLSRTRRLENGCLEWTGAVGSHGRYGSVGVAGRSWLAHRAAWFLFRGEDPGELEVCHKCDYGLCVDTEHLFLGTQRDNVHDMERKKRARHPKHEAHDRAKLNWDSVNAIRGRHVQGASIASLAREFGVTKTNIAAVVHKEIWITTQTQ